MLQKRLATIYTQMQKDRMQRITSDDRTPELAPREIQFFATLDGRLNSVPMRLQGGGRIDHEFGRTEGAYVVTEAPPDFSPYLLGPMLITGYPNASRSLADAPNIFKGRSYRYTRDIRFRTEHQLTLQADCTLDGEALRSRFDVVGTVPHESLGPLEPLVERWEPDGPGRIRGAFTAAWRKPNGEFLTADVTSAYDIDTDDMQPEILHRFVQMRTLVDGFKVEKIQDVLLFRDLRAVLREN
jgi:hypothetical protein